MLSEGCANRRPEPLPTRQWFQCPPGRCPHPGNHWNHCQNQVVPDRRDGNSKVDQNLSGSGTTGTTGTTEFEVIRANENFDERAALVEYGADVPRDWAEGFAGLTV